MATGWDRTGAVELHGRQRESSPAHVVRTLEAMVGHGIGIGRKRKRRRSHLGGSRHAWSGRRWYRAWNGGWQALVKSGEEG